MKNFTAEEMDDRALIAAFESAAISYGEAYDSGDPKLTNKRHDRVAAFYKEIERRGQSAMDRILPLLDAKNSWVRYAAAAYAIDFNPKCAMPVLTEMAKAEKALGMMAYTTLRNWEMKKGVTQSRKSQFI